MTSEFERPPSLAPISMDSDSLGFDQLRGDGIAMAQTLSGHIWTDFNLHDPGVTLLEAYCFSLTEGVFKAEHAVADLLCNPEGRIDFERHALHSAPRVMPTRALTREDYQRWILDRVPELEQVRIDMPTATADRPGGLWNLELQIPNERKGVVAQDALIHQAERAYGMQRNLCEDLDQGVRVLEVRECTLQAELCLSGPRDLLDLLMEFIQTCADIMAGEPRRESYTELLESGAWDGLDAVLEGPLHRYGRIRSEDLSHAASRRIFFSDLSSRLKAIDGLSEIRSLRLQLESDKAMDGSLPWSGPGWALQLRWPKSRQDLAGIRISRGGTSIPMPMEALLQRLQDQASAPRAPRAENIPLDQGSFLALPKGRYLEQKPFHPAQRDLPSIYRGGSLMDEMNGESQRAQRSAHALKGYLALFEQWLAHGESQRHHLRDLFASDAEPTQSYWWNMLEDPGVPGLNAHETLSLRAKVFDPLDAPLNRRDRVLDFLLSLHGETCSQNRLRAFGAYFEPSAWERHLFEQKRLMLCDIVRHTRDRMGAFDYAQPSMGIRGNTPVVQERLSLLLAFKDRYSRSLTSEIHRLGIQISPTIEGASVLDLGTSGVEDGGAFKPGTDARRIVFSEPGIRLEDASDFLRASWERLSRWALPLREGVVPAAFLRCAIHSDRYWCFAAGGEHQGERMVLGPDEKGHWWHVADLPLSGRPEFQSEWEPPSIEQLALQLRDFSRQLQLEGEGLHLVEHVLLRPIGSGIAMEGDMPFEFLEHRLTVIFPAWTSRGSDPAFRALAEESLELNLPAHLLGTCLWLELDELEDFERHYAAWLDVKRRHCDPSSNAKLVGQLDHRSTILRRWLWARLRKRGAQNP